VQAQVARVTFPYIVARFVNGLIYELESEERWPQQACSRNLSRVGLTRLKPRMAKLVLVVSHAGKQVRTVHRYQYGRGDLRSQAYSSDIGTRVHGTSNNIYARQIMHIHGVVK